MVLLFISSVRVLVLIKPYSSVWLLHFEFDSSLILWYYVWFYNYIPLIIILYRLQYTKHYINLTLRVTSLYLIFKFYLYYYIGFGYNVTCAVFCALSYHWLLRSIVSCCPLSFTYGEATVTTQAVVLFAVASITNALAPFHFHTCFDVFTLILQV